MQGSSEDVYPGLSLEAPRLHCKPRLPKEPSAQAESNRMAILDHPTPVLTFCCKASLGMRHLLSFTPSWGKGNLVREVATHRLRFLYNPHTQCLTFDKKELGKESREIGAWYYQAIKIFMGGGTLRGRECHSIWCRLGCSTFNSVTC